MPDVKVTPAEFAKKIKEKYPDYKDIEDTELAHKMIAKYPEYADQVDFEVKKKELVSPSPLLVTSDSANGASSLAVTGSDSSTGINYLTGNKTSDMPGVNIPLPANPYENIQVPEQVPVDNQLQIPQTEQGQPLAATTQLEAPVKDQNNFDPNMGQKIQELNPKQEALGRGMAKATSYLMQSPLFAYDALASTTNYLINKPLGLPDAPMSSQLGDNNTSIYKQAINDLETAVDNSAKEKQKSYDQEINQYLFGEKKDVSKGLNLLAENVIEAIPTSLGLAFAMSENPTMANAVGASAFAADNKRQLDKKMPDMPEDQKVMWSALSGGTEMALENVGVSKLGPMFKDILKTSGKEVMEKSAKELFEKTTGKIIKQYLGVQAEESASEMANTFIQNIYAQASGLDPDRKMMDGVFDSGLTALGQGVSMSTPVALTDIAVTKAARKKALDIEAKKQALNEDLQSEDVTPEAKAVISQKLKDINVEEADLAKEEREKNDKLSPDQKKEVDKLLVQSKKITDGAMDESVSDETKDILKKDLDAIDKKIDDVYEQSKNNKEPEVADAKVANQDTQDEIDYLNEVKNSGIPLTEEENSRLLELQPQQSAEENTPAIETGLVAGESKSEPIELSPNIEEITNQKTNNNENKTEKTNQAEETVLEAKEQPVTEPELVVSKKETPSKELIDEEEETIDSSKKDDDTVVQKMNTDIEAMKQMKTEDMAEKKFVGMIERAWKAKEEGKITRPTYTAFRNKAKDILGGKVGAKDNVDSTEAKLKVTAALNKVKEKLVGQNYKKITLSSIVPITPKNIADLIDLTNAIAHRAIDAGFTVAEATNKALSVIKKHPAYKKLIASKEVDEKDFEKAFKESKKESKSDEAKKKGSESDKIEGDNKKEPQAQNEVPDEIKKGKGKRKIAERLSENKRFKEISDTITDEDYNVYDKIDQKKANQYIKDKISEYEKAGLIEELANRMLDEDSPFPDELSLKAPLFLSDRLRVLAESEGNDFTKSALNKLAGKVNVMVAKDTTPAAQKVGLLSDINETLPLSVEGLKEFANEKISQTQDQNLTKEQQAEIKETSLTLAEIMESEEMKNTISKMVDAEITRIADELKGKEWTATATEAIDSLKIDLMDC